MKAISNSGNPFMNSAYSGGNLAMPSDSVIEANNNDDSDESIEIVDLIPGQSMGDLSLGMSREEVYKTLQIDLPPSLEDEDQETIEEKGIRLEYDSNQRVTLLESDATQPLFIDELDLFGSSYLDVVKFIKQKDPNAVEEQDSITSNQLGISIMMHGLPEDPPFLVAIFPVQK